MDIPKLISYEYIRGLVDGEGCFTFSTSSQINISGERRVRKIPAFSLAMHERDGDLIEKVRDSMGLKSKVYNHKQYQGDGVKRSRKSWMIVRDFGSLKNIIIPLFYDRLHGHKGKQFIDWLETIGSDPDVPESFKFLYELHRNGFYKKNPRFID